MVLTLSVLRREVKQYRGSRLGSITKAGPELLRRYLIHGARVTLRYQGTDRARSWAKKLEDRAGTNRLLLRLLTRTPVSASRYYGTVRDTAFGKNRLKRQRELTDTILSKFESKGF